MKEFWLMIQAVFTGLGGWMGYYLGGCDGLLYALIAFVIVDYLTGVMCAIADKRAVERMWDSRASAERSLFFCSWVSQTSSMFR
jgi:phage-related holin